MFHRDRKGDTEFHREKTNFTIAWLQQSGENEFSTAPESGKWPGKYPTLGGSERFAGLELSELNISLIQQLKNGQ